MIDNNFLLTYTYKDKNNKRVFTYEWFCAEGEMQDFVIQCRRNCMAFSVIDSIHILECISLKD